MKVLKQKLALLLVFLGGQRVKPLSSFHIDKKAISDISVKLFFNNPLYLT